MSAYLTLDIDANLTLSDVETWLIRARALGAVDGSPVRRGTPPSAQQKVSEQTLTVPVVVSLKQLPPAGVPSGA